MSDGIEMRNIRPKGPTPPPRHPEAAASGGLGKAYRLAEEKAKAVVHLQEGGLDVTSAWGCGTAIWFTLLATPLLLFPRLLLFFAQVAPTVNHNLTAAQREEHYDNLTPLESFLCHTIGFGLLSLSLIILFGLIPHYAPPATNPTRTPLLYILVGLTTIMAAISYNTGSIGALGKVVGVGNGVVAIWGWWVVVFGNISLKQRESKVPKRLRKL